MTDIPPGSQLAVINWWVAPHDSDQNVGAIELYVPETWTGPMLHQRMTEAAERCVRERICGTGTTQRWCLNWGDVVDEVCLPEGAVLVPPRPQPGIELWVEHDECLADPDDICENDMPRYCISVTKSLEGTAEIEAVGPEDALAYFQSLHVEAQDALVEQAGGWNLFAIETESVVEEC